MKFHEKISDLVAIYKARRKLLGEKCADSHVSAAISELGGKVKKSNFGKWRKGEGMSPRLSDVKAMAQLFGVSIEYLVRDDITDPHHGLGMDSSEEIRLAQGGPVRPENGKRRQAN